MAENNPYSEGLAKIINEEAELGFNISRFLWPVIGVICYVFSISLLIVPLGNDLADYLPPAFLFVFGSAWILGGLHENRMYQKLKQLREEIEAKPTEENGED